MKKSKPSFTKKICNRCGIKKAIKHFRRVNNRHISYINTCDKCEIEKDVKRAETLIFAKKMGVSSLNKKCYQCDKKKRGDRFPIIRDKFGGVRLNSPCNACCATNRQLERKTKPLRGLLASAKGNAQRRGIPFDLTKEDIIIPKRCELFGMEIDIAAPAWSDHKATLDRIVPDKGYVKGNVAIISWKANRKKSDLTEEEILAILKYIRKHKKKQKKILDN